ncbi:MAG: hypothetical protein Q9183_006889, partial [Haloplaca sp. 2 TL-2023]
RPFVNYYGPTFILYELSSPFLNFHWFFDKLHMTGSRPQWYNGILLLASFFCCRLLWGTYQSLRVYQDCWAALHINDNLASMASAAIPSTVLGSGVGQDGNNQKEMQMGLPTGIPDLMHYNPNPEDIPLWLALTYLGSNVVLNSLNFYWFGKMIETVKKRFRPKVEEREQQKKEAESREEEVETIVVEGVELDGRVVERENGVVVDGEVMNGVIKEGKGSGRDGYANGEVRKR